MAQVELMFLAEKAIIADSSPSFHFLAKNSINLISFIINLRHIHSNFKLNNYPHHLTQS